MLVPCRRVSAESFPQAMPAQYRLAHPLGTVYRNDRSSHTRAGVVAGAR